MNVYITGANGFLGKYIFEVLFNFSNIYTIGRNNSNINVDIRYQKFLIKDQVDLFVHIAGKAHSIPISESDKLEFYKVNVEGTKNVIDSLKNNPPKKFVFISSVSVYGIQSGTDITEDQTLLANDAYGLSKIQAEQLVIEWCKKNNVICTILRLPLLAGANPPGNLGAMIKGIKKGYYFNISGGKSQKSMVLVSDVAQCLLKVSEVGGIYNLTDGYHPSFSELSRNISLQLGKKFVPNIPLVFAKILASIGDLIGDRFPINSSKLAKIISPLTFDDSKAREAFGWDPTPVLEGFKISDKI